MAEIKVISQVGIACMILVWSYTAESSGSLGIFLNKVLVKAFGVTRFLPSLVIIIYAFSNFLFENKNIAKNILIFVITFTLLSNGVVTMINDNGGVVGAITYGLVTRLIGTVGFTIITALMYILVLFKIYIILPKKEEAKTFIKMPNIKVNLVGDTGTLNQLLKDLDIEASVKTVINSSSITRYKLSLQDIKQLNKLQSINNEIALALKVKNINITIDDGYVCVDIPKENPAIVDFNELTSTKQFKNAKITEIILGKNIKGETVFADICELPHILIAGATNSGKSVFLNTLIASLVLKADPDDLKLILIDPKGNELIQYEKLPHLLYPIINESQNAIDSLDFLVDEMEKRYKMMSKNGSRNIESYNTKSKVKMHYIICVIDEISDLMIVAGKDLEMLIIRLSQKARASGIHLVLATQRPSVKVITGLIKANIPSRISFAVASYHDSITILDMAGAELLNGKGDMFYKPISKNQPERIKSTYINDADIEKIVENVIYKYGSYPTIEKDCEKEKEKIYVANKFEVDFEKETIDVPFRETFDIPQNTTVFLDCKPSKKIFKSADDSFINEIIEDLIKTVGKISINILTGQFEIKRSDAAKIVKEISELGILSESVSNQPRKILISLEEWQEQFKQMSA